MIAYLYINLSFISYIKGCNLKKNIACTIATPENESSKILTNKSCTSLLPKLVLSLVAFSKKVLIMALLLFLLLLPTCPNIPSAKNPRLTPPLCNDGKTFSQGFLRHDPGRHALQLTNQRHQHQHCRWYIFFALMLTLSKKIKSASLPQLYLPIPLTFQTRYYAYIILSLSLLIFLV